MKDTNKNISSELKSLNRREAVVKAGKYAAFTAAAMMAILSPQEAIAKKTLPNAPMKKRPK